MPAIGGSGGSYPTKGPIGGAGGSFPTKVKKALEKIFKKTAFKKLITLIPFIMLAITMLTTFVRFFVEYSDIYNYLSQIMGYSVLTNIVFLFYAVRHKKCSYSFISIITLLLLNVSNVVALAIGLEGNSFYIAFDALLIVSGFSFALNKLIKDFY